MSVKPTRASASIRQAAEILNRLTSDDFLEVMSMVDRKPDSAALVLAKEIFGRFGKEDWGKLIDETIIDDASSSLGEVAIERAIGAGGGNRIIAAFASEMTANAFVDALLRADSDDKDLKNSDCDDRGLAILDVFVEVARRLNRLPDDYESGEMRRFDEETDRLYDAIVEGRRDDAIDILKGTTGTYLRSVAEQRNLFPERIP